MRIGYVTVCVCFLSSPETEASARARRAAHSLPLPVGLRIPGAGEWALSGFRVMAHCSPCHYPQQSIVTVHHALVSSSATDYAAASALSPASDRVTCDGLCRQRLQTVPLPASSCVVLRYRLCHYLPWTVSSSATDCHHLPQTAFPATDCRCLLLTVQLPATCCVVTIGGLCYVLCFVLCHLPLQTASSPATDCAITCYMLYHDQLWTVSFTRYKLCHYRLQAVS